MKRRLSPFVVAIPAFILVAFFKVWPIIYAFVFSLFNINIRKNIFSGEFAGLANFSELFGSYYAMRIARNTFVLTVFPAIITALVAFLAILFILKLPNRWTRCIALTVLAIPAFVPLQVLCGFIIDFTSHDFFLSKLLSSSNLIDPQYFIESTGTANLLSIPSLYPLIYTAAETLRYMFYPTALGVLAAGNITNSRSNVHTASRVALGYILVRLAFFMFSNRYLGIYLYNPFVYQTADTFTQFTYRKGLLETNFGFSNATDSFRLVFQLLLNLFIFLGLKKILTTFDDADFTMPVQKNNKPSWIVAVIGCILVGIGGIAIAINLITGVTGSEASLADVLSNQEIAQSIFNSFIYSTFSAILFSFLSVLLSYPLTTENKVYPLVLFLLMGTGFVISEYILFRQYGLLDKGIAVVLSSGIQVWGAFIIHLFMRNRVKGINSFGEYIRKVAPLIPVVFVLNFVVTWSSGDAMIYLMTRANFPISIILREAVIQNLIPGNLSGANDSFVHGYKSLIGIVGSLPPIILGWLMLWFSRNTYRDDERSDKDNQGVV